MRGLFCSAHGVDILLRLALNRLLIKSGGCLHIQREQLEPISTRDSEENRHTSEYIDRPCVVKYVRGLFCSAHGVNILLGLALNRLWIKSGGCHHIQREH